MSNAQIARVRHTSVHTVNNQIASIMRKIGVSSRIDIAIAFSDASLDSE
jgi:DNA-binding NarL/FixJ family response regulator